MAQTTKNSITLPDPGASAGSWGQTLNDAIESIDVLIDQHKVPSGGTSNQVLTKSSGTNYDVAWTTVPGFGNTVDSLTGGNGIDVSETTGDVTLSVNANTLRTHLSVEANSKDDQTGAEIKSLYEAESDTNAFTDSEKTKLTNINTATHTLDTDLTSVSTSDDSIASAKAIKDYVDTQDATKQNTIADGDLTIARTSGLQTALDGKQATITDGDLTIAKTSGLQTALDSKQATLTNGIADTNNVVIDSTSVADNEFAYFTANGLESLSSSEARVVIDAISQSAFNNLNGQLDTHVDDVSNPHSVTKTQVGLSNVENTALSTWAGNTSITDEITAMSIALG
tara:strand:- start:1382 stop:2401 length:1020 start_codon:yes stop_codon:yes gene_type:complete